MGFYLEFLNHNSLEKLLGVTILLILKHIFFFLPSVKPDFVKNTADLEVFYSIA